MAARNSASCWAAQWLTEPSRASAQGEHDQRLVVEPAHPLRAGELPVGVEAGHRRPTDVLADPVDLMLDARLPQHAAAGDAVECDHAQGLVVLERDQGVPAGGV